jgi:hypothetical protein
MLKFGYIVRIQAGGFHDTVISLKPTLQAAINAGLRHYRKTCLRPNEVRPSIEASPTMVL